MSAFGPKRTSVTRICCNAQRNKSFNDLIECSPHYCGRVMLIAGRCHCGNISLALDWRPEPSEIPARACTCSFGTKTAEFHVCTDCGVVPVVTSRIDGRLYAVVSVNTFENVDPALLRRSPSTFEGENEQARLSRRQRNWIADVQFEGTS